MDIKQFFKPILCLEFLLLIFGHIIFAACPDDGTPVLQMCTSHTLTVNGAYLDSRKFMIGMLECQCRVFSNVSQSVTVTGTTQPKPLDCKYTSIEVRNSVSGNSRNWTCESENGFAGILEPIRGDSPLSFALRRQDGNDSSTDSGYCVLLTAQSMITVICGENVTTITPTVQTTTTSPARSTSISTVQIFPFPRMTSPGTTPTPQTSTTSSKRITEQPTDVPSTSTSSTPITSASEQTTTASLSSTSTSLVFTASTHQSSSTIPTPTVTATTRQTSQRNTGTIAIFPFPPTPGPTTEASTTSVTSRSVTTPGSAGSLGTTHVTDATTDINENLTPRTASEQTGTRELIGIVVGCILGTILLLGIIGVCRYYYANRWKRNTESDVVSIITRDGDESWRRTFVTRSSMILKTEASSMTYKPSHDILFPPVTYLPTYKVC